MELRFLSPRDFGQLEAIVVESEAAGFAFLRRFVDNEAKSASTLHSAGSFFLAAFDAGHLVAVGGVTPDPYVTNPRVGRLRHVYVAESHRWRGVGRSLVRALETRACSEYGTLRLRTNSPGAAIFYERLAYRPIDDATATHIREIESESECLER